MEKKRLEYMDMAKGAGIIGIVIMHSSTMPDRVVGWLSSFALPLFFLIEYSRKLTTLENTVFPEHPVFSSPPLFSGFFHFFYIFIRKFSNTY